MADPYNFTFDVQAFLEEQETEAVEAPEQGVMKRPVKEAEPVVENTTDNIKTRMANALKNLFPDSTALGAAPKGDTSAGRSKALNDWTVSTGPFMPQFLGDVPASMLLETPPVTTTDVGPDMDKLSMQDAQDQAAIRSASGITESLGRPALAGLMAPPEQDVVSDVDTGMYSAVSGDTLSKIAKANNTTVVEIAAANPDIKDINKINVGQEIKLPTVTAEEAVTDDTTTDLSTYTEDYAKVYLKEHEGLKAHKSLEGGKDTAAMGIKFSLGLKRTDYASDAEFAGAVSLKHRDKAKAKFKSETWDALPQSVKYAVTDLHFNNGTIGSTGNKATTEEAMKNTLNYIGMTTKAKDEASLISLAKRRAWNWNKAASDMGVSEIAKIKQIPTTSGGTKFEYLASDGSVIHSVTTKRTPVKLNKAGTATTLTETRELTM